MIALIIADSFKRGMKSQGCPGLLKYSHKETLLQQQYRVIKSVFPKCKIIYIYGFDSRKLSHIVKTKYRNIHGIYNHEYSMYNHGYSLYKAASFIREQNKCLIMPGYDPLDKSILLKFKEAKSSSVALIDREEPKLGCVMDNSDKVQHIFYDLHNQISDICMMYRNEMSILSDILEDSSTHNMFLFELINNIITKHGEIYAIR